MKLPTLLLILMLTLIGAFTTLNWGAITVPTDLSLGFASVQLPLGLVMLGLLVIVTVVFLAFSLYQLTSTLLETRKLSREVQANRELSDQAEASRFTELRKYMETEMAQQTALHATSKSVLTEKMGQMETNLRASVEQSGNTLASYIGELEDRLERKKLPLSASEGTR